MTVLLTGASSGIGLGLLHAYLSRGAKLLTLSRNAPAAPPGLPPDQLRFVALDLASGESEFRRIVGNLLEGTAEIDLVVLNAGMLGRVADLAETPLAELERVMRVNVWANKLLLDEIFSRVALVRQVVAISSGASVSGARGWSGYGVSKAALNMLVRLYAAERPETHFCALAPGLVESGMQDYLKDADLDEQRFPVVARLRSARSTPDMPAPDRAAPLLIDAFERVRSLESGSYADIRKLEV